MAIIMHIELAICIGVIILILFYSEWTIPILACGLVALSSRSRNNYRLYKSIRGGIPDFNTGMNLDIVNYRNANYQDFAGPHLEEEICRAMIFRITKRLLPSIDGWPVKNPQGPSAHPWLHYKGIGLEIDGYDDHNHLAFESDGMQHHTFTGNTLSSVCEYYRTRYYDKYKKQLCDERGVHVVRIANSEIQGFNTNAGSIRIQNMIYDKINPYRVGYTPDPPINSYYSTGFPTYKTMTIGSNFQVNPAMPQISTYPTIDDDVTISQFTSVDRHGTRTTDAGGNLTHPKLRIGNQTMLTVSINWKPDPLDIPNLQHPNLFMTYFGMELHNICNALYHVIKNSGFQINSRDTDLFVNWAIKYFMRHIVPSIISPKSYILINAEISRMLKELCPNIIKNEPENQSLTNTYFAQLHSNIETEISNPNFGLLDAEEQYNAFNRAAVDADSRATSTYRNHNFGT